MKTSNFLLKGSKEYSLYVAQQRAIPLVADGLKAGQRIALWLLRNKAEKMKTIGLAGQMLAEKLYVHGDVSAANAISLLAAPYKNNVCLIEGLGSFGSRTKPVDGIGAPRYTEVRRTKAAQDFLYQDLPLVPLEDNYDGSNKQPRHFLPLIPTVLLNGVVGVAVGYSTEILPRSLKSIIDASKAILEGKKPKPLIPHYEMYNCGVKNIGDNRWEISGKVEIENTSVVRITELPPGMSVEGLRKTLIQMEDDDKIVSFSDDSSDKILIEVKLKRGAAKDWKEEDALDFFKLREKVTERIVVIDFDGQRVKTYADPLDLVKDFVEWRLAWYETRYDKLLMDSEYELLYWKFIAALFKDGFTGRLGKFADKAAVQADVAGVALKTKIMVDEDQRERAINLPTYRWTKEFEAEVNQKIKEMQATIKDYKDILAKPQRRKDIYLEELGAIR